MNKISARDVQVFVAGALAYSGANAFVRLLSYLCFVSTDAMHWRFIVTRVFVVLALPLGIGILKGSARAVLVAQISLWVFLVGAFVSMILYLAIMRDQTNPMEFAVMGSLDMAVLGVLLWLIHWSRSKRFRETAATGITN